MIPVIRIFSLDRLVDESGVSGTGIIAHGVEFPDGQCVVWWSNHMTIGIYPNADAVDKIHGHGGKTRIIECGVVEVKR